MTNDWKKEINTKLYELLSQYERDLVASGLKVDDSELNYDHLSMHRKSIVKVVETIIQSLLDKQIEEIEGISQVKDGENIVYMNDVRRILE